MGVGVGVAHGVWRGVRKASRMTVSVALMYAMHTLWYALAPRVVPNPRGLSLQALAHTPDGDTALRWFTGVYGLTAWLLCCWLPVCAFELLDRYAGAHADGAHADGALSQRTAMQHTLLRWKLRTGSRGVDTASSASMASAAASASASASASATAEPAFGVMAWRALRNELPTAALGLAFVVFATNCIRFASDVSRDGFGHTCAWAFAYVFGYDVVFWCGHKWMHASARAFAATHALHHSSHATRAVSHHYMSAVDFALETVLPAALPFVAFGLHPPAFAAFLAVGGWNGVVVHSGWDLPLCPAPHDHFLHHVFYGKNLALGLCDRLFGTAADGAAAGFGYAAPALTIATTTSAAANSAASASAASAVAAAAAPAQTN